MDSDHLTTVNLDTNSDSEGLSANRYPKSVAFVHDFLDSHGLDPYEFRVYCHIVRRTGGRPEGICFASLARIASTCKISERKTQQVLKFLIEARMITKQKNPGRKTDEYRVTLPHDWVPSGQLNEVRSRLIKRRSEKNV